MGWLAEAQQLADAGEPFALATVVRRVAPASAQPGAKAIVRRDGTMQGWVGGSCAQPVVCAEALRVIAAGRPLLLRLGQMPGGGDEDDVATYPMTCHSGGALEILIEPVLPAPRLTIVGQTPVAQTLAQLADVLGYRIERHDEGAALAEALATDVAPAFVVVAAMGDDEEAMLAALRAGAPYVALVASAKRASAVRETLLASGLAPNALSPLHSPAGLDIGAHTPEEIALSIMAEIVQQRAALAHRERDAEQPADPPLPAESARAGEALDPICGMTVSIAGARHVSAYDGKSWYFCGAGCKARFDVDPPRFAVAS